MMVADGFEVEMVAVKFLTHPMGGVPGLLLSF